jgi:hypothetical protein
MYQIAINSLSGVLAILCAEHLYVKNERTGFLFRGAVRLIERYFIFHSVFVIFGLASMEA